jgi:hypothetical protein
MDILFAGLYIIAIGSYIVGGGWLALLAYHDSDTIPWMVWFFPIGEIIYGLLHLRKSRYPLLIVIFGAVANILAYRLTPYEFHFWSL